MQPVFLMSPPRKDWTLRGRANFRSREAEPVNAADARREWTSLANAIVEAGGDVLVLPPNPRRNLTGLIYTAEAGEWIVHDDEPGFLLPNMAVDHRTDEADWIGGFFEGLGVRTRTIRSTWEAQGDAIRADSGRAVIHTFGSGSDARTAQSAYAEVADFLSERHIQLGFRADPWFHGNTFLNVYRAPRKRARIAETEAPVELVVVCEAALLPGEAARLRSFLGGEKTRWVEITRDDSLGYDTNALQVGDSVITSDTMSETTVGALRSVGLEIVRLDLSELFAKGGGAPVCLTNRLWGTTPSDFPARARWSANPDIAAHTDL
jgi:N-dimethylarginine dimethylaminohydrolase